MKELKRRTPEEVELWYLGKIASMTVEMMDFKDHAVEVLAGEIAGRSCAVGFDSAKKIMEKARAEARELLGIKEGE